MDGIDYSLIATVDKEERQYLDETIGNFYYKVTAYRSYCESMPAWTPGEESDFVVVEVTSVCEEDNNVEVYPNPANETLSIVGDNLREVILYNVVGQPVYRTRETDGTLLIHTSQFAPGIYTVQVSTSEGVSSKRITIIH